MKNKVSIIITILLCVLAVGALSYAGFVTFRFVSEYKYLLTAAVTEEDLAALKQENGQLEKTLSGKQQELQQVTLRKEELAAVGEDYEQEIRDCYIAKKEAESAARSLVLAKLENASYVTLPVAEQEKFGDVLMNNIIDEATGNAIVSAGVKSAIAAASEELSLESIVSGAVEGAVAEIPNFLNGEVTGAVADVIGIDVFGVAGWISEYMNADDTPVALANSMVTEQRQDVWKVLSLLEKEEITAADMQYVAGVMERIRVRGQELEAAGSRSGGNFDGAEQLQDLAKIWEENNYRILQYAGLEGAANEN